MRKFSFIITCLLSLSACTGKPSDRANTSVLDSTVTTQASKAPVDYVWPWLDSANSRWFYFNSAGLPFGLVNLSPDTEIDGAWGSGYRYNTNEVKGFNHVHAWQLSGLSVLPISTKNTLNKVESDYYSAFSHDEEIVKAGYHKLSLSRYGIDAELTATQRVGFHKYTYKAGQPQQIIFDMAGQFGPSKLEKGEFTQISDTEFSGYIINHPTIRRPRPTPIYFYIVLNKPVTKVEESVGAALLTLSPNQNTALMKVAISYVDQAGAKNNLQSELPGWEFEQTVNTAQGTWNEWLSRIKVSGGTEKQKTRFYTDLFHALQGRRTISDADGRYSDQTNPERKIKQLPLAENGTPQFTHHNSDSFWGAQWTIQTLWPLAYPEVASNFANSMLQMYKDGGTIPRGPSGGNYTYVMTGASSTPFFVSNYMKGIRDIDIELAYQALKKNHLPGGIMARAGYEHKTQIGGGLEYYIDRGYVPYPLNEKVEAFHTDGAGQTLEYAYQDWSLSQLAKALGKNEDAEYFAKRGKNYQNVFDTESGYMRPKGMDGKWLTPFDPNAYRVGFVESNASQMTWYVPHDMEGLSKLMGSKEKTIERLNNDFIFAGELGFTSGKSHSNETNERYRRIHINYGNQPSIQTAFLFHKLGKPELSQYWSRQVVQKVYSEVSPSDGYNGDEDQGLMGSLAVLMKIGLFQVDGGASIDSEYQIGSPTFDRIEIALSDKYYSGNKFIIETKNNAPNHTYVEKVLLNGVELDRHFLKHSEIVKGGTLTLLMSDKKPNH